VETRGGGFGHWKWKNDRKKGKTSGEEKRATVGKNSEKATRSKNRGGSNGPKADDPIGAGGPVVEESFCRKIYMTVARGMMGKRVSGATRGKGGAGNPGSESRKKGGSSLER